MFCRILYCFVAKSLFYAIYAVLSRNLFCRDSRALAWRKIEQKILPVEKKGQIWSKGMSIGVWQCFTLFSISVSYNCCSREESISKVIFVEKSEINFILAVLERDYRKCMHQRILNWIKFSWYGQYNPTFNKGCAAHCAHCAWCWTNILHIGKGQMENIAGGLTLYFQVAIFCCHDFHQEPHVVKKSTTSVK